MIKEWNRIEEWKKKEMCVCVAIVNTICYPVPSVISFSFS